ncbi:ATP-dependent DNA helicase RecG [Haliovirga abyssi]|uniref:ATP-dependent DNA helicase RecG n=1 Tax=Haliovirga abyssi TaxID=2996794 RepID=A0AAU9D9K8_9FUSO|nr:ATP-dependent DNA helicase RecG [Haliovirga abyssi]BDU50271.1 ATP-dependent DNA helicase RecG [Haliovirga abyssi]
MERYKKLYIKLEEANIKGLGEKTIEKLNKIKVITVKDLLYNFPRGYEDRRNIKKISNVRVGEFVTLRGIILTGELIRTRNKKVIYKIKLRDESGIIEVSWFQMPYLKNKLIPGKEIYVIGEIKRDYYLKMVNPEYEYVSEKVKYKAEILPNYSLISGLSQKIMRKIIKNCIEKYKEYILELIPDEIINKYKLLNRDEAIALIHFPKNNKDIEMCKHRFAVEELLMLEFKILYGRYKLENENNRKYYLLDKKDKVKDFLKELNFDLTNAQKRVITDIYKEIKNGKIVNRLIQGDVGSGKTIVAIIMLLYMADNGYQGVFMAPTEILAEQHYLGMVDRLNEIGIRMEILTGSIKGKQKEEILNKIKYGLVDIVVGTHALIEDNVKFKKLGLIVIDEQHKFGVIQRKRLREKGVLANLIVMSATPIPRSLALSIYGDLDVSIIDELPPGRQAIRTKWIKNGNEIEQMYKFIKSKLSEGRQCYIVAPLIEESEKLNLQSAVELYEKLKNGYFKKNSVKILHGRMKRNEKEEIMREFVKNRIQILVSTTVIEVGVNVPNASIMVISNSERFGLAQLHQLRGRVGRGEHKSYCFLLSDTKNEISKTRLKIMEESTDGFKIAEEDLKLRKSGEIFGTKQSGISDLRFVDIVHDIKTIKLAREEAKKYLSESKGKINNKILKFEIEKNI